MFWRRVSICMLCIFVFAIPFEHKYDKLFRFFSLKLIPPGVFLPSFFEKKIYFYPSDVIALGLLCIAMFAFRTSWRRFFLSKGAGFLWTVFFLAFVSIALSPLASYPIPYIRLLQLATPFLLYSFLANACEKEIAPLLLKCIVFAALIQSGIAIAQYAMQAPLGLRLLSEPNHFCCFGVSSGKRWLFDFHKIAESLSVIRPSGTFPHANVLGGFLSVSMLATYSFFFQPRWQRFAAFCIPIFFFAMSLTFSRSALFSWMLGTLVWFGLYFKKNGIRDPAIRLLLASICASVCFSVLVLHEQIRDRGGIVNYNGQAQGSDALRIRYQNTALQIIKENPIHGVGFQQLSIRSLDYHRQGDDPASGTHNIYLYLAAETGLFSLAAFLCFIFTLLMAAWKAPYTPLLATLAAIFIAFLFIGGCDFYPLLFQQGKLPFFLAAGLLAAHVRITKHFQEAT